MRRNLFLPLWTEQRFQVNSELPSYLQRAHRTSNDASCEEDSSNSLCLRHGQPSACIAYRLRGFLWMLSSFSRPKCFHTTETRLDGDTTAVNNHWTGLMEWTTGMDYWTDPFALKIIFMPSNEIFSNYTWPPASLVKWGRHKTAAQCVSLVISCVC